MCFPPDLAVTTCMGAGLACGRAFVAPVACVAVVARVARVAAVECNRIADVTIHGGTYSDLRGRLIIAAGRPPDLGSDPERPLS